MFIYFKILLIPFTKTLQKSFIVWNFPAMTLKAIFT